MMQKSIELCKKCREISLKLGISYNEMYSKIGISQSVFFYTEKGETIPTLRNYQKLLNFIEIHELHEAWRDNQDQ